MPQRSRILRAADRERMARHPRHLLIELPERDRAFGDGAFAGFHPNAYAALKLRREIRDMDQACDTVVRQLCIWFVNDTEVWIDEREALWMFRRIVEDQIIRARRDARHVGVPTRAIRVWHPGKLEGVQITLVW